MRARILLHFAALVIAVLPVLLWLVVTDQAIDSKSFSAIMIFVGPAIFAAQFAALVRWKALKLRAMANNRAWLTGLGMAAITHLMFGVLLSLVLLVVSGGGELSSVEIWWQFPVQVLFFALVSLSLTGVVTFPATAWIAHWIAGRYRKEMAREPA